MTCCQQACFLPYPSVESPEQPKGKQTCPPAALDAVLNPRRALLRKSSQLPLVLKTCTAQHLHGMGAAHT